MAKILLKMSNICGKLNISLTDEAKEFLEALSKEKRVVLQCFCGEDIKDFQEIVLFHIFFGGFRDGTEKEIFSFLFKNHVFENMEKNVNCKRIFFKKFSFK